MDILKRLASFAVPLLLLLLTGLSIYTYTEIRYLSLPVPKALALFTIFLPFITWISTKGVSGLIQRSSETGSYQLTIPLIAVIGFQLIYETVIATLALTYILPPSALGCGITSKWQELFRSKNSDAIRAIQDRLNCCGLNTVVDRAWPFGNPSNCAQTFGRDQSCFGPWRQAEQIEAGLLLLVAVVVFIVKVMSLISLLTTSTWAHPRWASGHIEDAADEPEEDTRATMRRLIENSVGDEGYHDEPSEESPIRTLDGANGHGPRVEPSPLIDHGNEWRDEGERQAT